MLEVYFSTGALWKGALWALPILPRVFAKKNIGGHFGPEQKKNSPPPPPPPPPPPKNSSIRRRHPPGPSSLLPPRNPLPPPGIFQKKLKNRSPAHPAVSNSPFPLPPPQLEKNKKYPKRPPRIDERQITHLICARLNYDLYDLLGAFWACFLFFFLYKRPQNTPLKKSYRSYFRRAQIR